MEAHGAPKLKIHRILQGLRLLRRERNEHLQPLIIWPGSARQCSTPIALSRS